MADYSLPGNNGYRASPRIGFAFLATDVAKSNSIRGNGKINSILLVLPAFTDNPTAILTIVNQYGNELYNSTAKADDATYLLTGIDRIQAEELTFTVTLSIAPGEGGGTAYVIVYYEP